MERVFIGLGGNQGDVAATFEAAIAEISVLPDIEYLRHSGLYRSPPWGGVEQPDFINAVLEVRAGCEPGLLLRQLLDVERKHGRNRADERHWGPRTLDCDILLFGERVLHTGSLTIPHPRMSQRAFVLVPLAELDAELHIPDAGPLQDLLGSLHPQPIRLIAER
jgi:2-amino-4-hydroxy-6-hydroxymethyldihydropteridine diphosphokinase